MRDRDEALCVERALAAKGSLRTAAPQRASRDAGGLGHERCERAIFVAGRDAQPKPSHLGGGPVLHSAILHPAPGQPHLALATIHFEEDIVSCMKQLVIMGLSCWCHSSPRTHLTTAASRSPGGSCSYASSTRLAQPSWRWLTLRRGQSGRPREKRRTLGISCRGSVACPLRLLQRLVSTGSMIPRLRSARATRSAGRHRSTIVSTGGPRGSDALSRAGRSHACSPVCTSGEGTSTIAVMPWPM